MYSETNDGSNSKHNYSPFRMRRKGEEEEENWRRNKKADAPSSPTNNENGFLNFNPTNGSSTPKKMLLAKPSEKKVFLSSTSTAQSISTVSVTTKETIAPTIIAPKVQSTPILLSQQPKENVATKFMNYPNFSILLENVHKILLEKSDYTVVGVLGSQQAGKSTMFGV